MSLRRRLVVGMLVLLIAAIVVADLVTSSYVRSFLVGRLDEQMDVAQIQAYTYIYETNQRAQRAHELLATSDPQAWLTQLNTPGNPSCTGSGPRPALGRSGAGTGTTASGTPHLNGSLLAARDDP
ncbi:MAG: hypothetical protein ACRDV4_08840, partial [Acidimicrobiales bacterium]